jgi:NADH-quinone oxidoreductase subunit L
VALWTLAVLTVVGGLVLVVTDAFPVDPASLAWIVLTLFLIAVGVVVALRGGLDRDPAEVLARRLVPHADRGLGADALYRRLVAVPVLRLARVVAFLDTEVVDSYVRGTAVATRVAGWAGARTHRGERPASAVALVVGAVVVLGAGGVLLWS